MSVSPAETAATLQKRSASARREAEARAAALRDQAVAIVGPALPAGSRAWLIGSLAWGGFGVRSDLDLVLSGVGADATNVIEEALCRQLQVDVDLLVLEELPASFQARIESEGIAIHGR